MANLPARQNDPKPGAGFLGWLGRQVGYVAKAIKTDVSQPPASKVVYRNDTVEELPHPDDPNLKLRRTVIDEVIVEKKPPQEKS
jgi:hypothetical protein